MDQIKAYEKIMEKKYDLEFLTKLAILYPEAVLGVEDSTSALDREIKDLYAQDRRVPAIKKAREVLDIGLKEAKDYCENLTGYIRR